MLSCDVRLVGKLGLGAKKVKNVVKPTKVRLPPQCVPVAVACGGSHTLLQTEASVFACGDNTCGQLGLPEVCASQALGEPLRLYLKV